MLYINLIAIGTILVSLWVNQRYLQGFNDGSTISDRPIVNKYTSIAWLLCFSLIIKLIISVVYVGFPTDMNCFYAWAKMAANDGISNFYSHSGLTDYPPGYIYILFVVGKLLNAFDVNSYSEVMGIILIKLPAILCDVVAGIFIYKLAKKKFSERASLLCCLLYIFNPLVVLDSSVWGQVDSVYTLGVILICYFITEKKHIYAIITFAIGVLVKPQTIFFTPVLIFACVERAFLSYENGKYHFSFHTSEFIRLVVASVLSILGMVVAVLPYGLSTIINQYMETVGSYEYATVNAYNFWMLVGRNWVDQSQTFIGIPTVVYGYLAIVIAVILGGVVYFKSKREDSRVYMSAAVINIIVFMFSVRMHERYMFAAIALLFFAYLTRPSKANYYMFVFFSVASFYNVAHVLFYYDASNYDWDAPIPKTIAAFTLLIFMVFMYAVSEYYIKQKKFKDEVEHEELSKLSLKKRQEKMNEKKEKDITIASSVKFDRLDKKDYLIMFGITILYALIAFYNLGYTYAPETQWSTDTSGTELVFDFGQVSDIDKVSCYLGHYEGRKFEIYYKSNEEDDWVELENSEYVASDSEEGMSRYTFEFSSVFAWNSLSLDIEARYVKLVSISEKSVLNELVFLNSDGVTLTPVNEDEYAALFDEQEMYEAKESYRSSTYFDEIYYARTGYDMLHGLYTYEWTHPPLGKIIIAAGMAIFGVNPFGWRVMGTLFGIAMLPLIYVFARRMFKKHFFAGMACALFALDFMHFAQTRIATIDVFVTFFILLMYYFMYRYISLSFYDTDLKKTFIPLGLCGATMGLAIASKMTGVYAAVGLAIIFFANLYKRYREYLFAKNHIGGSTNGISHKYIVDNFYSLTYKTILYCFLVFVFIPAIIYTLTYIPFVGQEGMGLIQRMLKNATDMFNYHSSLDATHPFSSNWYQWPIMERPIWYYSGEVSSTLAEGISSFGNPLIWWVGMAATAVTLLVGIVKKDRTAGFLVIGYCAQYLPWMLISRCTFIYHYFPSVPFVILMLVYTAWLLVNKNKKYKVAIIVYIALCAVLFAMFYPVLSGMTVSKDYVSTFLRWFDSWVLLRR